MSGEIRMAALQGLLTGLHRSPVQIKALLFKQYLDIISEVSTSRTARTEALKLAMGSSGHWKFESLFPEAFPAESQAAPSRVTDTEPVHSESWSSDAKWDYSAVEWKTPSEAKDEYDDIMRKLAAASHGRMNGSQITSRPTFPMQGQWR
jgi:hypothetical protein